MSKAATPKIQYVDVPSISETYADNIRGMMFDGQSVRLELCVTRMEEPANGCPEITGKRQTACRVVLPLNAALELSTKLGRLMSTLAKRNAEAKAQLGLAKSVKAEAKAA